MIESAAPPRGDAMVVRACLTAVLVQAVAPVFVAWAGYGAGAAADAAVVAVSSPLLLGVVAFGVVIAVALDRQRPPPALLGPVQPGAPPGTTRARLCWAGLAAVAQLAVTAAGVVIDSGARGGAVALAAAIDDGSAAWTFVLLVVQGGFIELRAPVAFGIAWSVLARAAQPVRPSGRSRSRRWPAARTRPGSRDGRSG